jgi:hypothetical protein
MWIISQQFLDTTIVVIAADLNWMLSHRVFLCNILIFYDICGIIKITVDGKSPNHLALNHIHGFQRVTKDPFGTSHKTATAS